MDNQVFDIVDARCNHEDFTVLFCAHLLFEIKFVNSALDSCLNFRRRIRSRLPFAGIIRRLTYSTRFQDKG